MKLIIALVASFFSLSIAAQDSAIELFNYKKKVRINTNALKHSDLIEAKSPCAGEVSITHTDDLFSGGCAGVIQRTYTLSDGCGNTLEEVQFITLEDNTAPVFINPPADITLSKKTDLKHPVAPAAEDESGQKVTVEFKEDFDHSDPKVFKVIRTWTARDLCDNTTTHNQVISIER